MPLEGAQLWHLQQEILPSIVRLVFAVFRFNSYEDYIIVQYFQRRQCLQNHE